MINDATLTALEEEHRAGITSAAILDVFASHGIALSEATLRKYVQLGLLPRSVRVGQKGKHQGSKGIYPVSVVRQILHIKEMMAQSYTIEQIQSEFLFMRADLQQLERTLKGIFEKLDRAIKNKGREPATRAVARDVREARALSKELLSRLGAIEDRFASRARVGRVAAS